MKKIIFLIMVVFPILLFSQTRNIVPRNDGEGQLGTLLKAWGKVHADSIFLGGTSLHTLLATLFDANDFDTRFTQTSFSQIKEVFDYEPVIADSSILLYNSGVWQVWDLGIALQSLVAGTPTLPDSIIYTSELTSGLASKQNTLVSGTNIKTINSTSLLGSGNIDVVATLPDSVVYTSEIAGDTSNYSVTQIDSLLALAATALQDVAITFPDQNTISFGGNTVIQLDPATLEINGSDQLTVVGGTGGFDSTYVYQRIANLESDVDSLMNLVAAILTALDTCGCGDIVVIDDDPPNAPTNLVATADNDTAKIRLTWTDPANSDLDSIRIYRAVIADTTAYTYLTRVDEGTQAYVDTGLSQNTAYWYKIKAVDDSSNVSEYSNRDSALTYSPPADTGLYKFDAEDGLANVTVNGDSVVVSTEQSYAGSYSYKIKGNGTANGVYMEIGSFPVAPTDTTWLTYRIYIPANTSTTQGWMFNVLFGYAGDWMTFGSGCLQGSGDIITAWQFPFGTEVTTNFSTGAWHKIEIGFIEGTGANAWSIAYVDETQVYTASDGDATEKPTRIALGAYNWYMDVGDAIYFDDIIISNNRLALD